MASKNSRNAFVTPHIDINYIGNHLQSYDTGKEISIFYEEYKLAIFQMRWYVSIWPSPVSMCIKDSHLYTPIFIPRICDLCQMIQNLLLYLKQRKNVCVTILLLELQVRFSCYVFFYHCLHMLRFIIKAMAVLYHIIHATDLDNW